MARTYKRDKRGRFARGGAVISKAKSVAKRRRRRGGQRSLTNRTIRHIGRTALMGDTPASRARGDAIGAEWAARRAKRKSAKRKRRTK